MATLAGAERAAADQEPPAEPDQKVGIVSQYVRIAENDEGWVVVGYRVANGSVDDEWMLLDMGITLQDGVENQVLARDSVFLVGPDAKVIPLATIKEHLQAGGALSALDRRASIQSDSINYFPAGSRRPCRLAFFSDPAQRRRGLARDEVDLDSELACAGRLYFKVPGGIQYGLYNLDVRLAKSVLRVPILIMTEEQAKQFEAEWKEAVKESKHKGKHHD
jgi:hypothetical protein